jgi:plastocyanin
MWRKRRRGAAPTTETAPSEETTLQLAADPGGGLSFDKDTLEAPAGTITIELADESSLPHNVAVEDGGVDEESETVKGESTSLTVEPQSGTYTFYCSVPGHREAGWRAPLPSADGLARELLAETECGGAVGTRLPSPGLITVFETVTAVPSFGASEPVL